jgi:hypothetical protein
LPTFTATGALKTPGQAAVTLGKAITEERTIKQVFILSNSPILPIRIRQLLFDPVTIYARLGIHANEAAG